MENARDCFITLCFISFVPLLDLQQPFDIEVNWQHSPNPAQPVSKDCMWNPSKQWLFKDLTQRKDLYGNANPKFQQNISIAQRPGMQVLKNAVRVGISCLLSSSLIHVSLWNLEGLRRIHLLKNRNPFQFLYALWIWQSGRFIVGPVLKRSMPVMRMRALKTTLNTTSSWLATRMPFAIRTSISLLADKWILCRHAWHGCSVWYGFFLSEKTQM